MLQEETGERSEEGKDKDNRNGGDGETEAFEEDIFKSRMIINQAFSSYMMLDK